MNIALRASDATKFDPPALNGRTPLVMKPDPGWVGNPAERLDTAKQGEPRAEIDSLMQAPRAEIDPLMQALLDRLPQPNAIWSIGDRAKWLKAAAMAFNLIYKTE